MKWSAVNRFLKLYGDMTSILPPERWIILFCLSGNILKKIPSSHVIFFPSGESDTSSCMNKNSALFILRVRFCPEGQNQSAKCIAHQLLHLPGCLVSSPASPTPPASLHR